MIYDHHSSCLCIPDIKPCPQCSTYDLWLSFFIFVYSRYKYLVHNVWHIIYDHRSSCFLLTEIKTVSLMFDRWSMIIVFILCFAEINTVSLMFNIPSMIFVLHLCLFQTKIPCQCSTYHLWSLFFMFLSYRDKNSVLNFRQMINDHRSLFCVL